MVERVEGVGKFAGIGGKDVRVESATITLSITDGELCNLLGKCDLLVGFKIIAFRKGACLLKNTAGTGMGILDVGPALALEVQCLFPVKDRALLRRDFYDIIPDGSKTDRLCD